MSGAAGAPLRVGIVGVRRVRQGLGEHFARWLVAAGARVPAFIGRSPETIREARGLLARHGIDAEGFVTLDDLLRAHPLDALVVASPAASHAPWLAEAHRARLHVLCEKPLVWDVPDPAGLARAIEQAFRDAGLLLREHCQWPEALPAFEALHPGSLAAPPRTLEMELAPSTTGAEMLVDTASHVVSMLQALTPPGDARLREVRVSTGDPAAERMEATFRFLRGGADVAATLRLRRGAAQPRAAALVIDGRRADRRISGPGYEMTFADGAREVPLPDPMRRAVARFVGDLAAGAFPDRGPPDVSGRMRLVAEVVSAFGRGT